MDRHATELRVRYAETDQMGIVYYANYLVWFEVARTEFFRSKGVEYRQIEEVDKVYIPVVEAYCRYKSPLRYDDRITVLTELVEMGKARLVFEYEIKRDNKTAAVGRTKHAFVDKKGRPVSIPPKVRQAFGQ